MEASKTSVPAGVAEIPRPSDSRFGNLGDGRRLCFEPTVLGSPIEHNCCSTE